MVKEFPGRPAPRGNFGPPPPFSTSCVPPGLGIETTDFLADRGEIAGGGGQEDQHEVGFYRGGKKERVKKKHDQDWWIIGWLDTGLYNAISLPFRDRRQSDPWPEVSPPTVASS